MIKNDDKKAKGLIKLEAIKMWQTEWESPTKGRTTFAFFDNIIERLKAKWIKPDHWCTQVLTGHGNFRTKLADLNLVNDRHCSCGANDTVEHFILECPKYETQRVALKDIVPLRFLTISGHGRKWHDIW